jgi:hypothetical protein
VYLSPPLRLLVALCAALASVAPPARSQLGIALGGIYAEPANTPRYGVAISFPIALSDHTFDLVPYGVYSHGKWKEGNGPSPSFYSTGLDARLNLPPLVRVVRPFVGVGVGALGTDRETRAALNLTGGAYVLPITRRIFPFVEATYRIAGSFDEPNLFDTISVQGGVRLALNDAY